MVVKRLLVSLLVHQNGILFVNAAGNWAKQFINKAIKGRDEDVGTSGSDYEVSF